MEIIPAETAGLLWCEQCHKDSRRIAGQGMHDLYPRALIHNEQVVNGLKEKGIGSYPI